MITSEEMNAKIEQLIDDFHGQIDDLYAIVGMAKVGRRYGWRVVRLTASRRHWTMANQRLGDFKTLMPERGDLAYRSRGLQWADEANAYWEIIRGHKQIPMEERRGLLKN